MKKMKKRRELDALVNGKLGRRKKGQHELLRNDSESSEVEEFSIPEKSVIRTNSSCRFCATCMTVCGFFLLAACVAAIAGLVWVHIETKKEVDQLRSQLGQIQSMPQSQIDQIVNKQDSLEKSIKQLENVVPNLHTNMSILIKKMAILHANITKLSKSKEQPVKQSVELQDVVQNVATMGSRLKTLEEEQKNFVHLPDQKIGELTEDLDFVNRTMMTHYQQIATSLNHLGNVTRNQDLRLSLVEAKPGSAVPNINHLVHNAIYNALDEVMSNVTDRQGRLNAEAVSTLQVQMNSLNESLIQLQQMENSKVLESGQAESNFTEVRNQMELLKTHTVRAVMSLKKNITALNDRLLTVEDTITNVLDAVPKTSATTNKSLATSKQDVNNTQVPSKSQSLEQPPGVSVNKSVIDSLPGTEAVQSPLPTASTRYNTTVGSVGDKGDHKLNTTGREAATPQTDANKTQASVFNIKQIQTEKDLEDIFPSWDINNDGSITNEELTHALGQDSPDSEKFQTIVALYDTDQDYKLSKMELGEALGFGVNDEPSTTQPSSVV